MHEDTLSASVCLGSKPRFSVIFPTPSPNPSPIPYPEKPFTRLAVCQRSGLSGLPLGGGKWWVACMHFSLNVSAAFTLENVAAAADSVASCTELVARCTLPCRTKWVQYTWHKHKHYWEIHSLRGNFLTAPAPFSQLITFSNYPLFQDSPEATRRSQDECLFNTHPRSEILQFVPAAREVR